MLSVYFVENFTRMYVEELGYVNAAFVNKDNSLFVNVLLGMGGFTFEIDLTDIFDEEDQMPIKLATKYLINEIEKKIKDYE